MLTEYAPHFQSLCHFLQRELSDYHQLLTTLELQMAKEAADPPPVASSTLEPELIFGSVPAEESRMTFQKLSLWAEDVSLKMRMMNALVDDARGESWCLGRDGSRLTHASPLEPTAEELCSRRFMHIRPMEIHSSSNSRIVSCER